MAKEKTYLGIDSSIWQCIKQRSAKEHGTRYTGTLEGTATTKTPFGDLMLRYSLEAVSGSLTYRIEKKPFMLPDDAVWLGVGETIEDCRNQVAGKKAPPIAALLDSLKDQIGGADLERVWSEHFLELAEAHAFVGDKAHETFANALRTLAHERGEPFPDVLEANGKPMLCLRKREFENWGRTVKHTPELTFFPKSKIGICRLVKWAAAHGKRVRGSGYRHTWSDLYGEEDHILVSMLSLHTVETLPAHDPGLDPKNELQGIEIVGEIEEGTETKALCKIGAATTNEQFRRWCLDEDGGNRQWTVPLNVIMVEITWGGSNAPICHGGGWKHETLSDLVAAIELVNARGELQVIDDPEQLRAAAGCFGLLGIVTSVTLKLDRMTYAVMKPSKPRLALTIPPPKDFTVPKQIDVRYLQCRSRCGLARIRRSVRAPLLRRVVLVPVRGSVLGQHLAQRRSPRGGGRVSRQGERGAGAGAVLSGAAAQRVLLQAAARQDASEAVRSGRDVRVAGESRDLHAADRSTPLPARCPEHARARHGARDPDPAARRRSEQAGLDDLPARLVERHRSGLSARRRADAHRAGDESDGRLQHPDGASVRQPVRHLLDRGAHQPQHSQGRVAQLHAAATDAWTSLTDGNGRPLNVRPHWAKQWEELTFNGVSAVEYLKTKAYREVIPEFRKRLAAAAAAGGCTLADLKARFSNPMMDDLFEEVFRT